MKKLFVVQLLILFIVLSACEKENNENIIIPKRGLYGENILNEQISEVKARKTEEDAEYPYSICAELSSNSSIHIKVKNLSPTDDSASIAEQHKYMKIDTFYLYDENMIPYQVIDTFAYTYETIYSKKSISYQLGTELNWSINPEDGERAWSFYAHGPCKTDAKIMFYGTNGKALIEMYENNHTEPDYTNEITW